MNKGTGTVDKLDAFGRAIVQQQLERERGQLEAARARLVDAVIELTDTADGALELVDLEDGVDTDKIWRLANRISAANTEVASSKRTIAALEGLLASQE